MNYDADIIVIGGGVIGLSAALYASKMGKSVLLFEKDTFGNQMGSSAGHVRMWRTAITELNHAKLAFASGDLFREIESESNQKLLHQYGLLNFGVETSYTAQGTIETAAEVLEVFGIKSIRYSKKQIEKSFPFKNLPDNYFGMYHEDNAVVDVKKFIKALINLNKKYGTSLNSNHHVTDIQSDVNGVRVTANYEVYHAKKVILSPGPYVNDVLNLFGFQFNLIFWEMIFAYYQITDPTLHFPMWFQFDKSSGDAPTKLVYGFPPVTFGRKGFVQLALDWASHTFNNTSERKSIAQALDIKLVRDYVEKHIRGLSSMPIDASAAMHPQIFDNKSVLDFMPEKYVPYHKNVVICAGGWAFKFAPLFGKICAELAIEGGTNYPIAELSILRENLIKLKEEPHIWKIKHA